MIHKHNYPLERGYNNCKKCIKIFKDQILYWKVNWIKINTNSHLFWESLTFVIRRLFFCYLEHIFTVLENYSRFLWRKGLSYLSILYQLSFRLVFTYNIRLINRTIHLKNLRQLPIWNRNYNFRSNSQRFYPFLFSLKSFDVHRRIYFMIVNFFFKTTLPF